MIGTSKMENDSWKCKINNFTFYIVILNFEISPFAKAAEDK